MADVFVSYSRADKARASEIVRLLEADGWSVFWDQELRSGTSWPKVLETELDQAHCLVALWTTASVESRWVRIEAYEALQQDKLLPVLLDTVKPPLEFRQTQTQDLVGWTGARDDARIARLLDDLRTISGAPQQPRKAPPIQPAMLSGTLEIPQQVKDASLQTSGPTLRGEGTKKPTQVGSWAWITGGVAILAIAWSAMSFRSHLLDDRNKVPVNTTTVVPVEQAQPAPAPVDVAQPVVTVKPVHAVKTPPKCLAIVDKVQQGGRLSAEEQAYLKGKECQ